MSFLDCSHSFENGDITHISSLKVLRIFIELLRAKVKLRKKKTMRDDFWVSLKRSIHCKPNPSEVHEPESTIQQRIPHKKSSNSKDCFQRKRNNNMLSSSEKPRSGSLIKSLRSSDILNPITHNKVALDISRCCPPPLSRGPHELRRPTTTPSKKTRHVDYCNECNISSLNSRVLMQTDTCKNKFPVCLVRGEKLKFFDAAEEHYVSQHSVIELDEEDSTRKIIETICGTSSTNSQIRRSGQIESVLKVQNSPRTFTRFEEYRDMVKNDAEKSDKKQPRCLVDGNEVLRFHGTTLTCSLATNGSSPSSSSGLCTSQHCCMCQILRHGSFNTNQFRGSFGVLTTSTCDKAFESIVSLDSSELSDMGSSQRKSVMVCRVIAGRVLYSSVEEIEGGGEISGFHSLAEERNGDSEIEDLYVLDPRAILPCFVIIYKTSMLAT